MLSLQVGCPHCRPLFYFFFLRLLLLLYIDYEFAHTYERKGEREQQKKAPY